MKGLMTIMAAILLAGYIQEPQADVEGLEAMRDAWQSALENGDANAAAALYTEDGVAAFRLHDLLGRPREG